MEESVVFFLGWVASLLCSLVCASAWLGPFAYLYFRWKVQAKSSYHSLLKKWADENGWEIVQQSRREFGSPWMFSKSRAQFVYYVAVAPKGDSEKARWAWVRCGGWFSGPKADKIEVRWDGEWQPLSLREPTPIAPKDDLLWDSWVDG